MKTERQPHATRFPFQKFKLCGAKTRKGTPCRAPATIKGRCRMHGGAEGSGAPFGNQNALKHGYYSAAGVIVRKMQKQAIGGLYKTIKEAKKLIDA